MAASATIAFDCGPPYETTTSGKSDGRMLFRDRNFLPLFPHTFEPGRCRASSLLTYTSRSRTSSRSTGDGEGYITLASPPPSPSPPSTMPRR